ncbi:MULTISPECIES: LxmA leader domain family RiPP [Streptomyces]|uniref:LxmA leader domain family RiPP n=1 Tax=Streptomyces sp. R28 TaxID=3238628 RepID=A0AB39Q5C8_9ACTN|nr:MULTISPECIES: LxmA leader domain family RiPP [Streptomyces]MDF3149365.1 LxmA leader domain family RiPP [Streptomyces sp. T21Q-yed]WDF39840.1 LxmA leader domain family RiPP [Streptomyces sp. T12]
MNTTENLIAGYTAYTSAQEIEATHAEEAPGATPSVLSFIATSGWACGAGIGTSIGVTAAKGC